MNGSGKVRDSVYKALADPTRRRVLRMLGRGERTAGEIAKEFAISAPSMSHHFNILKEADLVEARREGQQIVYSLNTTVFQDLLGALMEIFGVQDGAGGEEA
jgi:DNA-binding transcriptional ArsR family regulator